MYFNGESTQPLAYLSSHHVMVEDTVRCSGEWMSLRQREIGRAWTGRRPRSGTGTHSTGTAPGCHR